MVAKDTSPKTVIFNQRRNKLETLPGFPYGTKFMARVQVAGYGGGQITSVRTVGVRQEPNEVEITLDQ